MSPAHSHRAFAALTLLTVLGVAAAFPLIGPLPIILGVCAGTALLGAGIGWAVGRKDCAKGDAGTSVAFIILALLLTAGALQSIPPETRVEDAPNLASFFLAVLLYTAGWVVIRHRRGADPLATGLCLHYVFASLAYCLFNEENPASFAFSHAFLLVLLALWWRETQVTGRRGEVLGPLGAPILLLVAWGAVSTITSVNWGNAFHEYAKFLNYAATFYLTLDVIRRTKDFSWLEKALRICLYLILAAAFTKLAQVSLAYAPRVALMARLWISSLHPNPISAFLGILLPWYWSTAQGGAARQKVLRGGLTLFGLAVLILTYSRAGWLAALGGWAVYGLLMAFGWYRRRTYKPLSRWTRYGAAAGAALILAVALWPTSPIAYKIRDRLNTPEGVIHRVLYWKIASTAALDHPLTGLGLRNHYGFAPYTGEPRPALKEAVDRWFKFGELGCHAHNVFLEIAQAMGFLGLLGLLWLLGTMLWMSFQHWPSLDNPADFHRFAGAFAGLAAAVCNGFFDYPFGYSGIVLPCAALTALWMVDRDSGFGVRDLAATGAASESRLTPFPPAALFLSLMLCAILLLVWRPALGGRFSYQADVIRVSLKDDIAALKAQAQSVSWDPWSTRRLQALGQELARKNFPEAARQAFQKGQDLDPTFAFYAEKLGLLAWYFGDVQEAEKQLRQALRLDPYGVFYKEHFSDLGLFLATQGRREEAVESFAQGCLLDPAIVREGYWKLISVSGKYETLLLKPAFVPFSKEHPSEGYGFPLPVELMELILKQKHPDKSIPYMGLAAANRPVLLPAMVEDGFSVDAVIEKVRQRWEQLKETDPFSAKVAIIKLAKLYDSLDRFEEKFRLLAQNNLTFYALLDQSELQVEYLKPPLPGDEPSRSRTRGETMKEKESRLPDVRDVVPGEERSGLAAEVERRQEALRDSANSAQLLELAIDQLKLGRREDAGTSLRRLLQQEPENIQAMHLLATLQIQEERYEDALGNLTALKRLAPEAPSVYTNLGTVYALLHKQDLAIAEFLNGVRLAPANPSNYYNLGKLYYERGEQDKAFQFFSKTVALDGKAYFAYFHLAQIFETRDAWRREAMTTWEKFLELTKDQPALAEYRKKAEERVEALEAAIREQDKPRFFK